MNADDNNKDLIGQLARRSKKVLLASVLLSVFFHLLSYVNISWVARHSIDRFAVNSNTPVKVRIVETKKPDKTKDQSSPDEQSKKKIVEAILEKTEKPDNAKFSSFQDHKTERETRVDVTNQEKAKNAGPKGLEKELKPGAKPQLEEASDTNKPKLDFGPGGTLAIQSNDAERRKKRARYQKLMPKQADLAGVIDAGYQQHLDESIDLGDSIDINTSEYRFMGYFSMMRKAIELVWNYPMEAVRRGMQGEVAVEFVIHKAGNVSRVNVVKSSGYKILDDTIVEAVKNASPFAPLPDGFGKEKMKVTGAFRYILNPSMAGVH